MSGVALRLLNTTDVAGEEDVEIRDIVLLACRTQAGGTAEKVAGRRGLF